MLKNTWGFVFFVLCIKEIYKFNKKLQSFINTEASVNKVKLKYS